LVALGILIAANIIISKCKPFVARSPHKYIVLATFTVLECHIAAWVAAMFFEGPVVTLLLGCAALTSFLIIGVTWYYRRAAAAAATGTDADKNAVLDGIANLA